MTQVPVIDQELTANSSSTKTTKTTTTTKKTTTTTTVSSSSSPSQNTNMSSSESTTTETTTTLPVRPPTSKDESSDSSTATRDVPQGAEKSNPPAPKPYQLPEEPIQPDANSVLTASKASLKAPHLAHNARLRIHFEDLTLPPVAKFLSVMPVSTLLQTAISNVEQHLFTPSGTHHHPTEPAIPQPQPPQTTPNPTATVLSQSAKPTSSAIALPRLTHPAPPRPPPQKPIQPPKSWPSQEVRTITLVIRPMGGVAYTTGTPIDTSHKEIHLSTSYIENIMNSNKSKPDGTALFAYELNGVVTHEMVHVFQHDASGSCPGGLIEGIADYVRLESGLGAKHWNPWPANSKTRGERWDEGYQKTAWFLKWVEGKVGKDCIGELNFEMRKRDWDEGKIWKDVMGEGVDDMWGEYQGGWDEMNRKHDEEEEEEKGGKGTKVESA